MEWVWRRLARHVGRIKTQVEFRGISEEALKAALRQETVKGLEYIEAVVFSEEIKADEKIDVLKDWFLAQEY